MLLDINGFWQYDNRETLMQSAGMMIGKSLRQEPLLQT
jgi:hypothetical protein